MNFDSRRLFIVSSAIIGTIGLLVLTAWTTKNAINGGRGVPRAFSTVVLYLADLPLQIRGTINLARNHRAPEGRTNIYADVIPRLEASNKNNGCVLLAYQDTNGASRVALHSLLNNKALNIFPMGNIKAVDTYIDSIPESERFIQSPHSSRHRIWHPMITPDGRLIYLLPWNDIISVDLIRRKEIWRIKGAFHHSIEMDLDGNIWTCAATSPREKSTSGLNVRHSNSIFQDQSIVKVSSTGSVLKKISVADALCKSGLEYLLYGISNPNNIFDPIHLNQVSPILTDLGVLKKGCLLLSLRNMSTILMLNPESGIIEWSKSGPWMNQHCVYPQAKSTISILDNHSFASGEYWLDNNWNSRILRYNLESNIIENIPILAQEAQGFKIPIEGRAFEIKNGTWMVEDSLHGTVMIFDGKGLVFKWSNSYHDNAVGITSWCRYVKNDLVPEHLKMEMGLK